MANFLTAYRQLLDRFYEAVKHPGWHEHWPGFVDEANDLWPKLSGREQGEIQALMLKRYEEGLRP